MRSFKMYDDVLHKAMRCIDFVTIAPKGAQPSEHKQNIRQVKLAYTAWLAVLIDTCLYANLPSSEVEQHVNFLCAYATKVEYAQLALEGEACYDDLRRETSATYAAFKRQHPMAEPFAPFLKRWFRTKEPIWLQRCMTLFMFPFRTRIVDTDLEERIVQDYLDIEEALRTKNEQIESGLYDWVIDELNQIVRGWLRGCDPSTISPRHGAGAVSVAGCETYGDKDLVSVASPRIDYAVRKTFGSDASMQDWNPFPLREWTQAAASRQIFVPKNATKLRGVCCEPPEHMFWQNGVMDCMYKCIAMHPYLCYHVPILPSKQMIRKTGYGGTDYSRHLALVGSQFNTLATIDYSAASDRIPYRLVQRLFSGTKIGLWLNATRTTHAVLPNGDRIRLEKWAPMGASICFPVMSLLFASINEYVGRRSPIYGVRAWSVYGDDNIVPTKWAPLVTYLAELLGLKVNRDKSFADGPYRESCGVEAWKGVDVTPFRFPRTLNASDGLPSLVPALIDMANRAMLEFNMPFARYALLQLVTSMLERDKRRWPPLLYDDGVAGVYSPAPTNYTAKHRYNDALQRDEVFVTYVSTRKRMTQLENVCDDVKLFWWLRDHAHDNSIERFRMLDKYSRYAQPVLRTGWLPCPG